MKKILGLAFAGAMLIACGSSNKNATGMQGTTAATTGDQNMQQPSYTPPPSSETAPANPEGTMPPSQEGTPPSNQMPTNPNQPNPNQPNPTP